MQKESIKKFLKPNWKKIIIFFLLIMIFYVFSVVQNQGNYLGFGNWYFTITDNYLYLYQPSGGDVYHFPEIDFLKVFIPALGIAILLIYIASCVVVLFKPNRMPILKHWQGILMPFAVLLIIFSPKIIEWFLYNVLRYLHPAFSFMVSWPITKYNAFLFIAISYSAYFYLLIYLIKRTKPPLKYNLKNIILILLVVILTVNLIASFLSGEEGLKIKEEGCGVKIYNYKLVAMGDYGCTFEYLGEMLGSGWVKYFINIFGKWIPLYERTTFII